MNLNDRNFFVHQSEITGDQVGYRDFYLDPNNVQIIVNKFQDENHYYGHSESSDSDDKKVYRPVMSRKFRYGSNVLPEPAGKIEQARCFHDLHLATNNAYKSQLEGTPFPLTTEYIVTPWKTGDASLQPCIDSLTNLQSSEDNDMLMSGPARGIGKDANGYKFSVIDRCCTAVRNLFGCIPYQAGVSISDLYFPAESPWAETCGNHLGLISRSSSESSGSSSSHGGPGYYDLIGSYLAPETWLKFKVYIGFTEPDSDDSDYPADWDEQSRKKVFESEFMSLTREAFLSSFGHDHIHAFPPYQEGFFVVGNWKWKKPFLRPKFWDEPNPYLPGKFGKNIMPRETKRLISVDVTAGPFRSIESRHWGHGPESGPTESEINNFGTRIFSELDDSHLDSDESDNYGYHHKSCNIPGCISNWVKRVIHQISATEPQDHTSHKYDDVLREQNDGVLPNERLDQDGNPKVVKNQWMEVHREYMLKGCPVSNAGQGSLKMTPEERQKCIKSGALVPGDPMATSLFYNEIGYQQGLGDVLLPDKECVVQCAVHPQMPNRAFFFQDSHRYDAESDSQISITAPVLSCPSFVAEHHYPPGFRVETPYGGCMAADACPPLTSYVVNDGQPGFDSGGPGSNSHYVNGLLPHSLLVTANLFTHHGLSNEAELSCNTEEGFSAILPSKTSTSIECDFHPEGSRWRLKGDSHSGTVKRKTQTESPQDFYGDMYGDTYGDMSVPSSDGNTIEPFNSGKFDTTSGPHSYLSGTTNGPHTYYGRPPGVNFTLIREELCRTNRPCTQESLSSGGGVGWSSSCLSNPNSEIPGDGSTTCQLACPKNGPGTFTLATDQYFTDSNPFRSISAVCEDGSFIAPTLRKVLSPHSKALALAESETENDPDLSLDTKVSCVPVVTGPGGKKLDLQMERVSTVTSSLSFGITPAFMQQIQSIPLPSNDPTVSHAMDKIAAYDNQYKTALDARSSAPSSEDSSSRSNEISTIPPRPTIPTSVYMVPILRSMLGSRLKPNDNVLIKSFEIKRIGVRNNNLNIGGGPAPIGSNQNSESDSSNNEMIMTTNGPMNGPGSYPGLPNFNDRPSGSNNGPGPINGPNGPNNFPNMDNFQDPYESGPEYNYKHTPSRSLTSKSTTLSTSSKSLRHLSQNDQVLDITFEIQVRGTDAKTRATDLTSELIVAQSKDPSDSTSIASIFTKALAEKTGMSVEEVNTVLLDASVQPFVMSVPVLAVDIIIAKNLYLPEPSENDPENGWFKCGTDCGTGKQTRNLICPTEYLAEPMGCEKSDDPEIMPITVQECKEFGQCTFMQCPLKRYYLNYSYNY